MASATSKFSTAAEVALHVLRNQGPKTTHQLHKACLAIPAKADKPYIAPHHRDYRLRGDQILGETVRPPNPEHLVRSVKFLKQTLRELESRQQVGHTKVERWLTWAKQADQASEQQGSNGEAHKTGEVLKQAEALSDTIKAEKLSEYIWIDWDLYKSVKPKPSSVQATPNSRGKTKDKTARKRVSLP